MSDKPSGALQALLSEIVDYAGLFPPAKLTMAEAVQNYHDYLHGEHAWMLGRFVVAANALDDFAKHGAELWTAKAAKKWRVTLLAGQDLAETARCITEFNQAHKGSAEIDALELRIETGGQIAAAKKSLPAQLATFFEIPLTMSLAEQVSTLALNRYRAKIRTGGVVPEAFPPVDEVLKFARVCLAANVPFKATAGLHHPLRASKPLTYETDSPKGTMHGFLNLFLTVAFMRQNLNSDFSRKLLSDGEIANFEFDDAGVKWNDKRIETAHLKLARARNIISFGSCSFTEPIADLQQLELL